MGMFLFETRCIWIVNFTTFQKAVTLCTINCAADECNKYVFSWQRFVQSSAYLLTAAGAWDGRLFRARADGGHAEEKTYTHFSIADFSWYRTSRRLSDEAIIITLVAPAAAAAAPATVSRNDDDKRLCAKSFLWTCRPRRLQDDLFSHANIVTVRRRRAPAKLSRCRGSAIRRKPDIDSHSRSVVITRYYYYYYYYR